MNRSGYGSHDAGWLAFYDYFRRAAGLECAARLAPMMDLARVCGWWWPFAGAVVMTEKPCKISRDAGNRLHCEDGAAIEYPDGWGIHAWHGLRVSKKIIEAPETITVQEIEAEQNAEIRRVMIERYGLSRYVRDAKFEVLDADVDPLGQPRRLLRKERLTIVELTNSTEDGDGTRRRYHIPVHPELRPLLPDGALGEPQRLTALAAVASTYGLRAEEYALEVET